MPQRLRRWPLLRRVFERAHQLDRMMAAVSVDPVAAARKHEGAAFAAARRACINCPNGGRCEAWLASSGEQPGAAPEFCPNARFFRDLEPGR